jgi:hypothetical protein
MKTELINRHEKFTGHYADFDRKIFLTHYYMDGQI